MRGIIHSLWRNNDGAVAPMVAVSLVALIAAGGIAFDYAHVAALDTELQQAADQAALAAATQLDGQTGAIARATAAAQSLISNSSMFANDGSTQAVTVPTLTFCSAFNDAEPDTSLACTATTDDTKARTVWVKVGGRTAFYALTPIVGAFSSGTVGGEAVAGMNSAVCKEPPVMMCNPAPDATKFDADSYIGKGIRLIATGGGGSYAPGDFGFLDVGAGASDLAKLMGYGSPPDKCVDVTNPSTETGSLQSVVNEFNTRFDMYESGDSIGCFGSAKCPPSINSRKDVVMNHIAPYSKSNCGIVNGGGGKGWVISDSPYRPVTDSTSSKYYQDYKDTPDAMGYPRDGCHAVSNTGVCAGDRIGDGSWDIDAYWRVNHGSTDPNPAVLLPSGKLGYPTSLNSTIRAAFPSSADSKRAYPTRYQVYRWEIANAASELPTTGRGIGSTGNTDYGQPVCLPPGWTPAGTTADRRTIPIAVVNCTGLNGKKPVNPIDWIDSFLVEPSVDRGSGPSAFTKSGDIYVEIIGHTGNGSGGSTAQVIRHDRPYLIR